MVQSILDRHVDIDPQVCSGRPRLTGTRITVADVAVMHLRLGLSVDEIATKYDLPLAGVHSALAYYHDHRKEIDASIAADEQFADAFERKNPSLLQARLRALNGQWER